MAYEFDANAYERASAHQKEWGLRLIGELDLRGDERVLDLGCGDGRLTAELARCVPQGSVLGIDASDTMIEAARQRTSENLRFEVKDIDTLHQHFAETIAEEIKSNNAKDRPTKLILPVGPIGQYPILIDMKYKPDIKRISPDIGLRALVHDHSQDVMEVEVDAPQILKDIDKPEDYMRALKKKEEA